MFFSGYILPAIETVIVLPGRKNTPVKVKEYINVRKNMLERNISLPPNRFLSLSLSLGGINIYFAFTLDGG